MMLEDLKPVKVQPKCKVGRFYDELEASDQKLLKGYLEDLDFSAEALSVALKSRTQSDIGPTVIRKHRKGECPCAKLS
jgi:hypothetical protein